MPSELIDSFDRWIPIKKMNWKQSTLFICWYFEQLGYKVTRLPKSHDNGGDIILDGYIEKIVIQVKHRKETTGTRALQEVLYGKKCIMQPKLESSVLAPSPNTHKKIRRKLKSIYGTWNDSSARLGVIISGIPLNKNLISC